MLVLVPTLVARAVRVSGPAGAEQAQRRQQAQRQQHQPSRPNQGHQAGRGQVMMWQTCSVHTDPGIERRLTPTAGPIRA
jgi:hypothetical protein